MQEPRLHHVSCLDPRGLHRMAYWEWGARDNPRVVLCVHGLTRQGRDFDALAARLSGQYRVICPDVVGRGESDWLGDPLAYQVPTYVADMVTLLARLDVAEVAWVGTSMGGLIGMAMASLPGNPVARLVLNDVGPAIETAALQRIGQYLGRRVVFSTEEEAAAALWLVSQGFGPHTPQQWLALTRPQLKPAPEGGFELRYDPGIAQAYAAAIEPAVARASEAVLWSCYDRIACPTLLLRGAQSDLLSAATAQAMTQRGPRARLASFEGVGHAPTLVADDQQHAVESFLSDWQPGSTPVAAQG